MTNEKENLARIHVILPVDDDTLNVNMVSAGAAVVVGVGLVVVVSFKCQVIL